MNNLLNSIDPLEAKSAQGNAAAQAAIKREIENILSSYVGWFDPFAELIQNSLDSIEERAAGTKQAYEPKLRIIINLKKKETSLTVSDNGTGLSKEKYRQFLAPSFSFKSGKTRGHKGVGATFLAYGFNYMQISTKTPDYSHVGKMENARKWLSDPSPASNPLIIPDNTESNDSGFSLFDRGVSISLKFDSSTVPGDLEWIKADTAKVWKDMLLLKTGLGAITGSVNVEVTLEVIASNGTITEENWDNSEYNWPHQIVTKSKSLYDVEIKSKELHEKNGKDYRMPVAYRNLDCIYEHIQAKDLKAIITLSTDEEILVKKHNPFIYLCYAHSARVWSDYNESLRIRGNVEILKPGIQIAANGMPQGEIIQIPLKRNIGRQNQVHFVAHFDDCKADLGRKGFQKEIVSLCEEISRKLMEGPFQKAKHVLKASTGAKTDLKRERDLDDWKVEMECHEKKSPLVLKHPHFFLPTKQVSILSTPTREQDVIALFNQLIAGGVIRGIKIMSTNERFTYDGMYRITFSQPDENHIYEPKTNPLGILKENMEHVGFISKPKILEYKLSLNGLIEDLETGEKNAKDLGLVIVWETEDLYQHNYQIVSLLDPDNLSERQYHGVTHVMQNLQTGAREMDLIVLSELISYLNDTPLEIKNQTKKYD
jgi:Histidine kinase-, DNA gyrase B-, and HSP90-like ATPase